MKMLNIPLLPVLGLQWGTCLWVAIWNIYIDKAFFWETYVCMSFNITHCGTAAQLLIWKMWERIPVNQNGAIII